VCRAPSSANVIKDGGFDSQSALSKWTSSGTTWSNSDGDSCPASGSITINGGKVTRCFQVPPAPPGTQYAFGFQYKAGTGSNGCFGGTFQDANCSQNGSLLINLPTNATSLWSSAGVVVDVPENTSSISVECQTSSFLTMDQVFLRATGYGF